MINFSFLIAYYKLKVSPVSAIIQFLGAWNTDHCFPNTKLINHCFEEILVCSTKSQHLFVALVKGKSIHAFVVVDFDFGVVGWQLEINNNILIIAFEELELSGKRISEHKVELPSFSGAVVLYQDDFKVCLFIFIVL